MRSIRILPIFGGMLVALWLAPVALAHAHYVSSNPATGAHLGAPPASIVITYDDALDPNATMLTVLGPSGQSVTAGKTVVKVETPKVASVPISSAGSGTYTVKWHAVADDDKGVTEGTFTFTVGATAASASSGSAQSGAGGARASANSAAAPPALPTSGGGGLAMRGEQLQAGMSLAAALVLAVALSLVLSRRPMRR